MEQLSIRLESGEREDLENEADERGFSNLTEYLRWIIRNRDSIEPNTTERLENFDRRISELEEKVDD